MDMPMDSLRSINHSETVVEGSVLGGSMTIKNHAGNEDCGEGMFRVTIQPILDDMGSCHYDQMVKLEQIIVWY
jgi:hypothetical protein